MTRFDALEALVSLVEDETGANTICSDEPNDGAVGWNGDGSPLPMTFGHVRRAREELDALKKEG